MRPRIFNCTYALAGDDIVRLPNVSALPHVGAATRERREALAQWRPTTSRRC